MGLKRLFRFQWDAPDKRQDLNRLLVLFSLSLSFLQCWKSLGSPFRADDKHLTTETNVVALTPLQRGGIHSSLTDTHVKESSPPFHAASSLQ